MEMEWTWLARSGGGGLWLGWLVTSLDIWWHVTPHLAPGVTQYFVIKTKTETAPEKKRSRVRIKDIILSSCKQSHLLKSSHVSLVSLNSRNARSGWLGFWCFKMRNIKSGVGLHVSYSQFWSWIPWILRRLNLDWRIVRLNHDHSHHPHCTFRIKKAI